MSSRMLLRSAAASFLLISMMVAIPVIACYVCKKSPDGYFGFCDPTQTRGWNDCTTYVYDSFNGRVTCSMESNNCPYGLGDYPPGGPIDRGGSGDCYWEIDGECQLYY